jgi:alkylation response protein AidB-like acyl-CoA dehydrogenase
MSNTPYPTHDQDLAFLLFDYLKADEVAGRETFNGSGREDLEMILGEAKKFAKEEVWPTNAPGDREGCRFEGGQVTTPESFKALYAKYMEFGWLALTADERYGGSNLPACFGIAVGETMTGANISFSPYPGLARGVARVVDNFGDEWMKEHVVTRLYSGEWGGTMCLTEPHAGTAVGDLKSTAVKDGETYRIKGQKIFITGGEQDLTDNIVHLVLARVKGAPKGIKGVSLFLVGKKKLNQDGTTGADNDVACTGIEHKMGLNGSSTCQLSFGDEGTCEGWLIGEENRGIQYMFQLMNEARIGTGVHGLAAGALSYGVALGYAKERVQGTEIDKFKDVEAPRVTIDQHPDVKRMLFTMKARTEGLRAMLYTAAKFADDARSHPDEDERERAANVLELLTPLCKSHGSDIGYDIATMALQTMGGAGYTGDWPVEQAVRDVKVASVYEGANGIQALDLIGRKLGHNKGASFLALMERIGGVAEELKGHPTLSDLAEPIEAALGDVREVTGQLAAWGLGGEVKSASLYACAYLTALSQLVTAWLLADQAMVAEDALGAMLLERDISDAAAKAELIANNPRAAHLASKSPTARFYAKTLLLENKGLLAQVKDGDREILEWSL